MLHRVVKIQSLACFWKTVVGQPPNPDRAVADDQRARSLAQSTPQGFGMELLAQGVNARACGDKATLTDDRSSTRGLSAMV